MISVLDARDDALIASGEDADADTDDEVIDDTEAAVPDIEWREHIIHDENVNLRSRTLPNNLPIYRCPSSGPKHIFGEYQTPLDLFQLFMTDDIIDTFVKSTNAYTTKTNDKWKQIHPNKSLSFFAIIICFVVVKLPQRCMAWTRNSYFRNQLYLT